MFLSIKGFPAEPEMSLTEPDGLAFAAESDEDSSRGRDMRPTLLLVVLMIAAAAPAAAQSCATLGGGLDCGASPSRPAIKPPPPRPAGEQAQTERTFETSVSNHGVATTFRNSVTDSHGVMEFGFSGATGTPCRIPGYGAPCQ
jgi:hypothetical protein